MNDPCLNCPHLAVCDKLDIIPNDCEDVDFNDPESISKYLATNDDELANTAPWNITDNRLIENILDYGDADDTLEEDE